MANTGIGNNSDCGGRLRAAVRGAALSGLVDRSGAVCGTRRIRGYVCYIHPDDDEEEDLRGTIDVQEYDNDYDEQSSQSGYHEGVRLTALLPSQTSGANRNASCLRRNGDNNSPLSPFRLSEGKVSELPLQSVRKFELSSIFHSPLRIMRPALFSDVIVGTDPLTGEEFVEMFSQLSDIECVATEGMAVGVVSAEPFEEGDEGEDYDNLPLTGRSALTTYTDSSITAEVIDSGENSGSNNSESSSKKGAVSITSDSFLAEVSDSESNGNACVKINNDSVVAEVNNSEESAQSSISIGDKSIAMASEKVAIDGSESVVLCGGTEAMVLGDSLVSWLKELCQALQQLTVLTPHGTSSPPLNASQFASLAAKSQTLLSKIAKLK